MERNNNTYGALINNKFSKLLSADSTETWAGMKELLDKKMPEKKKRRWLLWFTRKTAIAIVLLSLFASAAGAYIGLTHDRKEKNNTPGKDSQQTINTKKTQGINEIININTEPEKINPLVEKRINPVLPITEKRKSKNKRILQTQVSDKDKQNNMRSNAAKELRQQDAGQKKFTTVKDAAVIDVAKTDSVKLSVIPVQNEEIEKRRAF